MTSKILTKAITIGGDPPILVVHIQIDCDQCGQYSFVLLGHHVTALRQALQEVADREPVLTDGGEIDVVYRDFQQHTPGLN